MLVLILVVDGSGSVIVEAVVVVEVEVVAVVIATVAAAVAVSVIPMVTSGIPCILSIPNLTFIFLKVNPVSPKTYIGEPLLWWFHENWCSVLSHGKEVSEIKSKILLAAREKIDPMLAVSDYFWAQKGKETAGAFLFVTSQLVVVHYKSQ